MKRVAKDIRQGFLNGWYFIREAVDEIPLTLIWVGLVVIWAASR